MSRRVAWAAGVALLVALVLGGLAGNVVWRDRLLADETPEARLARLAPHWRLVRPAGEGPAPVAVLLSGCDGPRDNMDAFAALLARSGWASLIVDSHTPRGLDDLQAWRLVCGGQALSGAERAGDAAVAMAALGGMAGIDASQVMLLGASHGGWTALELLVLLADEAPPPGLSAWPLPPGDLGARIRGVVLLYPYCGRLNAALKPSATVPVAPLLLVLAGQDSIVGTPRCEEAASRLAGAGTSVEIHVLPGVDHAFDQREHAALSTLAFDAEATARAEAIVEGFVRRLPRGRPRRGRRGRPGKAGCDARGPRRTKAAQRASA